ncbi:hypothetical protein P5673_020092 [Acropora cervicornis]|uniref:Uncharacterized protein n=1 Tax=Acropora cervicornis TaxID=6130 RepID=A0AAD9QAC5_ACRCE|nr:hypothetical protein P5673_020092 [Acropora cervicornis]
MHDGILKALGRVGHLVVFLTGRLLKSDKNHRKSSNSLLSYQYTFTTTVPVQSVLLHTSLKLALDLQERSFPVLSMKGEETTDNIYFNRDLPMVSLDPYQNKESTPTRVECGRIYQHQDRLEMITNMSSLRHIDLPYKLSKDYIYSANFDKLVAILFTSLSIIT